MFIMVFDEDLRIKLKSLGFKELKSVSDGTFFVLNKNIKFNFELVDKNKYLFTNKLSF